MSSTHVLKKLERNKFENVSLKGFLLCYRNSSKTDLVGFFDGAKLITKCSRKVTVNQTHLHGKTYLVNSEKDRLFVFEINGRGSERELQNTESVVSTHNMTSDE